MKRVLVIIAAGVLALAGCTSDKPAPTPGTTSTIVSTVTATRDTGTGYKPPKVAAVKPLPPGTKAPRGEKNGTCPYVRAGVDAEPTSKPNVANIEGNRIYRVTRLTTLKPIGCRFYFYAPPYNPTADILPQTFATPAMAYNAMILTSQAGKEATTYANFAPGLTGISYRTKFDDGDGYKDWAFVFTKGKVMVVVHTSQPYSFNARALAQAIAAKF